MKEGRRGREGVKKEVSLNSSGESEYFFKRGERRSQKGRLPLRRKKGA